MSLSWPELSQLSRLQKAAWTARLGLIQCDPGTDPVLQIAVGVVVGRATLVVLLVRCYLGRLLLLELNRPLRNCRMLAVMALLLFVMIQPVYARHVGFEYHEFLGVGWLMVVVVHKLRILLDVVVLMEGVRAYCAICV